MVECAGLEIRYTVIPYREFKSHSFRQNTEPDDSTSFGFLFATVIVVGPVSMIFKLILEKKS